MSYFTKNRRRRRKKSGATSWLILLLFAAGIVYSLLAPEETKPRPSGGNVASGRATAIKPRATTARATLAATATKASASGCFQLAEALAQGELNIRESPSTSARILGTTPLGERYKVLASQQRADYCWLDIGLGWIAASEYVSGGRARASAPASAPEPAAPAALHAAVQKALDALNRLAVAAENRCSPYDSDDYPYPQSVEAQIVARMGGRIYGPYSGRTFGSMKDTDIEHIVAKSEAHDSGLCAAGEGTRRAFARDLLNLTLASPSLNRNQKSGKDFAEWRPPRNKCWFADTIIKVKSKYRLTVDSREKRALETALRSCASVNMQ